MIKHYARYSIANLLVIFASFISFPILTRFLDNTQYGILSYFATWMAIAISIAKLGAQHGVVRFYPYGAGHERSAHFGTNFVLLPIALSLTLWAMAVVLVLGLQWSNGSPYSIVFWCVLLITPISAIGSVIQMVMRAREQSGLVMATKIIWRWLELVLVVGAVVALERSASSVYGGRLVAAALVLLYFLCWTKRNLAFSRDSIDLGAFKTAMLYGLPLMVNEFAGMTLVAIDRVMLKHMTGDYAVVGIYAIGYSLAMQINVFMNATLSEAFIPVANRVHGAEGDHGVRELKGKVLLPMTYVSVAVVAMLIAVGEDALVALSGPDKAASGRVFVIVGTVLALYPLVNIASYGLLLRNRSVRVLVITSIAAIFNIMANLVMIPRYGYMGAAWATVISYVALCTFSILWCPRGLLRLPDMRSLAISGGCALLLLGVTTQTGMLGIDGTWPRLFVAGILFVVLYALPVLTFDSRLRRLVLEWLHSRRQARAPL